MQLEVPGPVPPPAAKVVEVARRDDGVMAVTLYGSYARGESSAISDIDICIIFAPTLRRAEEMHGKRMKYLEVADSDSADVQVFQQLPLNIRSTILKEGRMVLVKDENALYDLAFETIKEFEDFRKHYDEYLAGIADAESDRILAKMNELQNYIKELKQIKPSSLEEYSGSIEKRRSVECLLQISIECVLDICSLLGSGLKLGLPSSEQDLLEKIESAKMFQPITMQRIKAMRAFRNILVHRYGRVDDAVVFRALAEELSDFDKVVKETLDSLKHH